MFYRTIFVCLVGFVLVKLVKMDPSITFNIQVKTFQSKALLTCDHTKEKIEQSKEKNLYTVYEGGNFTIVTKYNNAVNHIICYANTNNNKNPFTPVKRNVIKSETTFTGAKIMGTLWKCEILAHRNGGVIETVVDHKDNDGKNRNYSAAYCYMTLHMRQKEAPQTILVNNMELPAVRTNLSQKDVDFISEYQYVDGDAVNVICMKKCDTCNNMLSMEYNMAGTTSDESIMDDLKSSKMVGFKTRLHSGHNNSYMICTHTNDDDYTKVMVRFVEQTESNIIGITIDGTILRPHIYNAANNHYRIDYKYVTNKNINVTCEVKRTEDVKLILYDEDFKKEKDSDIKSVSIPKKKFETTNFYLTSKGNNKELECSSEYGNGAAAESVRIVFHEGIFPVEQYPLHIDHLPSNGTVMELYNDHRLNVIFYEFEYGETLQLKCGQLLIRPPPEPVLNLEFDSEICSKNYCDVPKNLTFTRENAKTSIVCNLKEPRNPSESDNGADKLYRQIKVIFRERVLTTTSTTTTTTTTKTTTSVTTPNVELPAREIASTNTADVEPSTESENDWLGKNMMMKLAIIACCVVCIIIICASIFIIKLRKRNHSQGGPHNRNYENLQEQCENSIPTYPPQWENNYAVPVDRRTDDTTYSEPCPPADLYATPMPKSLRNKKQKPLDPTYAVLTVPKKGQKNMFKETEDPNYSEVYASRPEACYAKVLPKSQRNKAEQDNPYSYVTNDRPCAFAADSEPMYCEPGKARDAEYANLNNSHYANSNAPEYVEPTYCEPQKQIK